MTYLSVTASRVIWLLLAFVFGAMASYFSFQSYRAMTSKHWPTTNGQVFAYYDAPNYRYKVAGATYEASRISCNEFFGSRDRKKTDRYLMFYPLGANVVVRYHPSKPELAVLETDFDSGIFKAIGVLSLLVLVCLAGYWRGWRWKVRRASRWLSDE